MGLSRVGIFVLIDCVCHEGREGFCSYVNRKAKCVVQFGDCDCVWVLEL